MEEDKGAGPPMVAEDMAGAEVLAAGPTREEERVIPSPKQRTPTPPRTHKQMVETSLS